MITVLGIDIAKAKFDIVLLRQSGSTTHKIFANTPAGFAQLQTWLQQNKAQRVHACLEATGTLGEALASFLVEAGHIVSVVNPAIIANYAKSQLSRTKTDKTDAHLIARFCSKEQPPAWTPAPVEVRELQALVRRLESLHEMLQMEQNRLAAGIASQTISNAVQEHVAYLEAQIGQTKKLVREHIEQHPALKNQRDLLVSIPGIGQTTAAALLAELGEVVSQFAGARQVAAFAGLVPRLRDSGTKKGHVCLSKWGTGRLRRALYFPAITAVRYNAPIRALSERLSAKGKCKLLIIGAAMRKLLHLVYGVLKSGKPFDPAWAAART
jgi:transposase